ncbi:MAG: PfkB family carbohydrate kinase [Planctomycetota bacterium]
MGASGRKAIVVVGSIAFDSIETPHGRQADILGGSAVYFSAAASLAAPVRLVGVVGEDFPKSRLAFLARRGVDLGGLVVEKGRTFRWKGRYEGAMNEAKTLDVALNVFGTFRPCLPGSFRDSGYVFLANGSPVLQREVLRQVRAPKLIIADTMNLWIEHHRPALRALLREVDGLVLNDGEARMLAGTANLVAAGRRVQKMGPRVVVVKKGEHGCLLFHGRAVGALPSFPTERVVDPTGAGDSFAGGMMGHLARTGDLSFAGFRKALVAATVTASFTVEGFGLSRLARLTRADIARRAGDFRRAVGGW